MSKTFDITKSQQGGGGLNKAQSAFFKSLYFKKIV